MLSLPSTAIPLTCCSSVGSVWWFLNCPTPRFDDHLQLMVLSLSEYSSSLGAMIQFNSISLGSWCSLKNGSSPSRFKKVSIAVELVSGSLELFNHRETKTWWWIALRTWDLGDDREVKLLCKSRLQLILIKRLFSSVEMGNFSTSPLFMDCGIDTGCKWPVKIRLLRTTTTSSLAELTINIS